MEVKDWRDPIHPGEILRDELETMGMTPFMLARHLHIPNNRLYQILDGRRGITADTALRLSKFFGTTPEFWLGLQQEYELDVAKQKKHKGIELIIPYIELQKQVA